MISKYAKNNSEFQWTSHIKNKMRQYGLSESRLKRILENPARTEQGVAEGVIALMQNANTKRPTEIWLMYKEEDNKKVLISAWRYPGISPIGSTVSEQMADGGCEQWEWEKMTEIKQTGKIENDIIKIMAGDFCEPALIKNLCL